MAAVAAPNEATLTASSGLIGMAVNGSDGGKLGTIAELMIAAGDGRIVYAALATGGFGGVGEMLHAVPWSGFVIDPVDGRLSLPVTRAEVAAWRGFDKDRWPVRPEVSVAGQAATVAPPAAAPR